MASFLERLRTVVKAEANNLLDKVVDMNSIPVLKQYVRDLEQGLNRMEHEAAVARASVVTLNRESSDLSQAIAHDKEIAKVYLARKDEGSARMVAMRIHDHQQQLESYQQQIIAAQQQAQALQQVVEKLTTRHQAIISRLRILETKDRSARALEAATRSLKGAQELMAGDVDASVDNLAGKIEARADVAQEEFASTVEKVSAPLEQDPTRDAEVDNILESLREPAALPATTSDKS